eukprot:tig00020848_g14588.t1
MESMRQRREKKKQEREGGNSSSSSSQPLTLSHHPPNGAPLPEPHALQVDPNAARDFSAQYYAADSYAAQMQTAFPPISYPAEAPTFNGHPGDQQSLDQKTAQLQQAQAAALGSSSSDVGLPVTLPDLQPGAVPSPDQHEDMNQAKARRGRPSGPAGRSEGGIKLRARELTESEFQTVVHFFAQKAAEYEMTHPEDPRGFMKKGGELSAFSPWVFETIKSLKSHHPDLQDVHPGTLKGVGCAQFGEYREAMQEVQRKRRRPTGGASDGEGLTSGGESRLSPLAGPSEHHQQHQHLQHLSQYDPSMPAGLPPTLPLEPTQALGVASLPMPGAVPMHGAAPLPSSIPLPSALPLPSAAALPSSVQFPVSLAESGPVPSPLGASRQAPIESLPGPSVLLEDLTATPEPRRKRGRAWEGGCVPKRKQREVTPEERDACVAFFAQAAAQYAEEHPEDPRGFMRDPQTGQLSAYTLWAYDTAKQFKARCSSVQDLHPGTIKSTGCQQFPEYREAMQAVIGRARGRRGDGGLGPEDWEELAEGEPEPLPEATLAALAPHPPPPDGPASARGERQARAGAPGEEGLSEEGRRIVAAFFAEAASQYAMDHPEDPRGCLRKDGDYSPYAPWISEVVRILRQQYPRLEAVETSAIRTAGCMQFHEFAEAAERTRAARAAGQAFALEEQEAEEAASGMAVLASGSVGVGSDFFAPGSPLAQ